VCAREETESKRKQIEREKEQRNIRSV